MNYKECISYINKLYIGKKTKPTLDRVIKVLNDFSFKNNFDVVHVAGTNGKGSTCMMISNILIKAGYKVGLYTSPHLVDINERIKINNINISNDDFSIYVSKVIDRIKKLNVELLFFEVLTVAALLYYNDKKCDIVVLETGLGGEFDATNVIEKPICTVITNIGLEHEDVLGKGIENISKAKAMIMRKDVDCVLYDIEEGKDVFIEKSKAIGSILHICDFKNIHITEDKKDGVNTIFSYKNHTDMSTNLIGMHQVKNACVSIDTIDILKEKGYKINEDNIKAGLNNISWNARFQILQKEKPMIILDGGHNPQCIDVVVDEIRKLNNKNVIFVVSIVQDKDVDLMAKKLSMVSKKFVLTHIDNKRGMNEKDLLDIFSKYSADVVYRYDIFESIDYAKELAKDDGIVCIVGSLYFAGDVLKKYNKN